MTVEELQGHGYYSIREIPGQGFCGLMKFAFTTGLVIGMESWGYKGRYCYSSASDAQVALDAWNGEGDPGGPWIKYKGIGGEREGSKNCEGCSAHAKV
jgi:hypothetical protein